MNEAYRKLVESGELTARQTDVYETMFVNRGMYHTGMSAREINAWMKHDKHHEHSGTHSRLRELEKIGLVKKDGKKVCSITKKTVNNWKLT